VENIGWIEPQECFNRSSRLATVRSVPGPEPKIRFGKISEMMREFMQRFAQCQEPFGTDHDSNGCVAVVYSSLRQEFNHGAPFAPAR
jgi:hypothetical protein